MLRQPLSNSTAKISMAVLSLSTRLVLVKTAPQVVVAAVGALMGLAVTSAAVVAVAVVVMTVAVAAVAVVVAADAATSVVVNLAFSFKTGTNCKIGARLFS
jgi:hypothetical protein